MALSSSAHAAWGTFAGGGKVAQVAVCGDYFLFQTSDGSSAWWYTFALGTNGAKAAMSIVLAYRLAGKTLEGGDFGGNANYCGITAMQVIGPYLKSNGP